MGSDLRGWGAEGVSRADLTASPPIRTVIPRQLLRVNEIESLAPATLE
jgi:hypothetical protein